MAVTHGRNPSPSLPSGPAGSTYGLMGGLVRCGDTHIFSNVESDTTERRNGHLWLSADGGATWPTRIQVCEGGFAYSSLAAHASSLYLLYEGGPKQCRRLLCQRFDLRSLQQSANE